jgi:protein-glutamine gamma-glutamyltransferase
VRLAAFGALAAFGTAHWNTLVADAPAGRTLLVVVVAVAAGAAVALVGRLSVPRPAMWALAALIGLVALVVGLMAAGLPGRLLLPAHWAELTDGLDRGLAGVQGVEWPYDGPDEWIRLTILLGAPFLLAIAATVTFWPAGRAAPLTRGAGLVALLVLYGTAVTEYDPGAPALRGLVLLLLVAAWLWLPRVAPREAALGAAVVAGIGVLSLPLAAALDGDRPWWDYRAWGWFGGGKVVSFDWSHEYGPLDWPRDGTTLLNVRSDRPHYWKVEALDTFDGLRWTRTGAGAQDSTGAELAFKRAATDGATWDYSEYNPAWNEEIGFTVRSLSSDLVVGAGITYDVNGIDARTTADGTTFLADGEDLRKGDTYTVEAYAPDPTKAQMQGAPKGYADDYGRYTAITLPSRSDDATEGVGLQGDAGRSASTALRQPLFVPLRGEPGSGPNSAAARVLEHSRYARMYRDSRRLIAGEPTAYDAVKAVEKWLQDNYSYSERVPTRPLPLNGFLYEDERGYCQQFSGTMALMLRMAGIPSRVAAGFSPGSYNKDTREYRVRDLDAHSWVEVWFTGIGWVPFDPTPPISPAESQSAATAASAAASGATDVRRREGVAAERTESGAAATGDEGGGWLLPAFLIVCLMLLGGGGLAVGLHARRVRALRPGELADAQLSELRRTLVRLGWDLPTTTTLLSLERRLGRFAGPASEAYAGALRATRFDPRAPDGPELRRRRDVRRELSRGNLRDRLLAFVAMPPGGPRA